MTVIDVSLLQTITGGTGPFSGKFVATPWAGRSPFIGVDGKDITVPSPVVVQIVDGDPVEAIDLLESGAEFCWKLAVTPKGSASSLVRYVAVPSLGPVAFGDLVDVDPLTFQPAGDGGGILLWSPNGTRFRLAIGNDGTVSATPA